MGSKTRRLRVAAGVAGLAHQADVRRAARAAVRAGRLLMLCKGCQRVEPKPGESLCLDCSRAAAASMTMVRPAPPAPVKVEARVGAERVHATFNADHMSAAYAIAAAGNVLPASFTQAALQRQIAEERRLRLRMLLDALHPGEDLEELATAVDIRAREKALASPFPTVAIVDDVWEGALAELRRGVSPRELSVLALDRADVGAMRTEMRTGDSVDEVLGEPFEGTIESVTIEGKRFDAVEPAAPPAPREPGMRRINRAAVPMALATLLAMASFGAVDDPKEER